MIVGAIKQACQFQINVDDDMFFSAQKAYQQILECIYNDLFSVALSGFDSTHQTCTSESKG